MLNVPLGPMKTNCLIREGQPPIVVDLDKGVCFELDPIMHQILTQYNQFDLNHILKNLKDSYAWTAIEAAVLRLVELAELGVIFAAVENQMTTETSSQPQFVVSPGFIRNLQSRSHLSNTIYYALLSNLSQHTNLSVFVPDSPNNSQAQDTENTEDNMYPLLEKIPYASHLSYAAVTNLPSSCDAIVMFTPLHDEDFQFLTNSSVPILLFTGDYIGSSFTFDNLSPAYSRLKDTDIWFCPYLWLESKLRDLFPDLPCLNPLPLGVDPLMIRSLPEKSQLKFSLSQALDNDAFNNTPTIGIFGSNGDWLADQLATNDLKRLYLCIAGTQRNPERYHAFIVEDTSDVDILPHILKALDLLIFIARGNVEPYILSLAAAVGIPIIVICETPLPDNSYFGRLYHCDRLDVPTIQQLIKGALGNGTLSQTVDLDSISWDATSKRILQLYAESNAKYIESHNPSFPQPPEHLFTKFYDPAQKKIGTRCTSLNTLENVPLEVGFAKEMQRHHTIAETNIILAHLGREIPEITDLVHNSSEVLNATHPKSDSQSNAKLANDPIPKN